MKNLLLGITILLGMFLVFVAGAAGTPHYQLDVVNQVGTPNYIVSVLNTRTGKTRLTVVRIDRPGTKMAVSTGELDLSGYGDWQNP